MHKNIIVFLLFLPFIGLKAQNADIRKIYRYADRSEDTQKIKLPGGVMDLALLIMKKDLIEDMGKKSYKALKGINKLRIISSSNTDFIQHQKTERHLKNIRTKMESLISINSEGQRVNIMIYEKKDAIRRLVISVHSDDELTFISANTKIKLQELQELIKEFQDNEGEFDFKV